MSVQGIEVEQHFTPAQLAAIWKVAPNTIRHIFENEDGVLIFGTDESRHRRRQQVDEDSPERRRTGSSSAA
jgi:hypothetical protein